MKEPQSQITHEFFTGLDCAEEDDADAPEDEQMAAAATTGVEEEKDNRHVVDNNRAQFLRQDDVLAMKESAGDG